MTITTESSTREKGFQPSFSISNMLLYEEYRIETMQISYLINGTFFF